MSTESTETAIDWTSPEQVAAKMGVSLEVAAEPAAPVEAPVVETKDEEEQPQGVLSKAGKSVLPYGVLVQARKEASEARARSRELESQIATLQAATKAPTLDELTKQFDDYPEELLAPIREAQAKAQKAEERASLLENQAKAREEEARLLEEQLVTDEHAEAIKSAPFLDRLGKTGGPIWEQAIAISERLAAEKPISNTADRIDNYAATEKELRELLNLPATVPTTPRQTPPASVRSLPTTAPSVPASLSNIPGGVPPATSEAEAFTSMDGLGSVGALVKMSPAQMESFIAKTFGGG